MDLNERIIDLQRTMTHFRIALASMNNEINRLGPNNPNTQTIIAAINFFSNWYDEINSDYHTLLNRANERRNRRT